MNKSIYIYIILLTIYLKTICMQGKGIRGFRMFLSIEPLHVHLYLILPTIFRLSDYHKSWRVAWLQVPNLSCPAGFKSSPTRDTGNFQANPAALQVMLDGHTLPHNVLWPERAWWHSQTSSQKRPGGGNDSMLSHQGWSSTGKGCGWQGAFGPAPFCTRVVLEKYRCLQYGTGVS